MNPNCSTVYHLQFLVEVHNELVVYAGLLWRSNERIAEGADVRRLPGAPVLHGAAEFRIHLGQACAEIHCEFMSAVQLKLNPGTNEKIVALLPRLEDTARGLEERYLKLAGISHEFSREFGNLLFVWYLTNLMMACNPISTAVDFSRPDSLQTTILAIAGG